jgi:hypothetical protein
LGVPTCFLFSSTTGDWQQTTDLKICNFFGVPTKPLLGFILGSRPLACSQSSFQELIPNFHPYLILRKFSIDFLLFLCLRARSWVNLAEIDCGGEFPEVLLQAFVREMGPLCLKAFFIFSHCALLALATYNGRLTKANLHSHTKREATMTLKFLVHS